MGGWPLNEQCAILQTAEYIQKAMPHCSLHTDEGLRERNVGPLHGLLWSEAAEKCPEAFEALTSRDPERRIPGGGESPNDLEERAVAAVRRIGGENAGARSVPPVACTHALCTTQLTCHTPDAGLLFVRRTRFGC